MTKKEAKKIARDILQERMSVAYYFLVDDESVVYSEEEKLLICEYIDREATRMLKIINRHYYTL